MAGRKMMRKRAIGILFLALSVHGASALTSPVSSDLSDGDWADGVQAGSSPSSASAVPAVPAPVVVPAPASAPAPVAERALSDNPLWGIPLTQLPVTRDRPIFSSSRRPPPPAVAPADVSKVVAIPKPSEPERPQLSLVGTIVSDDERFGIFLDQSTNAVLRLKVDEDYQGWKLRSVQSREATFERDQEVVTLPLPQPGGGQGATEVRSVPEYAGRLLPVMARPRPHRSSR
jgi:general secretion pathway protein N